MAPSRIETMSTRCNSAPLTPAGSQRPVGQTFWQRALDLIASLAMLVVAGGVVWNWHGSSSRVSARTPVSVPQTPVSLEDVPLLGDPEAKAALLVFSDFQCPFCARFVNEALPVLKQRYVERGVARVGFRHLPLLIHDRALRAADSAECAAEQGQFWRMHDALFRNPARLEETDLILAAAAIGLDPDAFRTCMQHGHSERVERDLRIAQSLGFRGTPSFVVGRIDGVSLHATSVLVGAQPFDVFEKALQSVLDAR
jgi:protein-disulfide isomerase